MTTMIAECAEAYVTKPPRTRAASAIGADTKLADEINKAPTSPVRDLRVQEINKSCVGILVPPALGAAGESATTVAAEISRHKEEIRQLRQALQYEATIGVMRSSLLWGMVFVLAFSMSAVGRLHLLHPALAVVGFVCSACFFLIGWLNAKRHRKGPRQ